jgi:hypothetical protein
MTSRQALGGMLIIGLCWATTAESQGPRYLGPSSGTPTGWVELSPGQVREVAIGTEIAGWGRVTRITETHLVVERRLSETEQAQLRSQGMAVYGAQELHIPRTDLGVQPLPSPR